MNFHKNQNTLRQLFQSGWRKNTNKDSLTSVYNPGVYMISQKKDGIFKKIGMAHGLGGIYERLTSYKLCFAKNDEFWISFCVICPRNTVEYNGKQVSSAYALEQKIIRAMKMGNEDNTETYSNEYMVNTQKIRIETILKKVLTNNSALWTHALKFSENNWAVLKPGEHGFHQKGNSNKSSDTKALNGVVKKPKKGEQEKQEVKTGATAGETGEQDIAQTMVQLHGGAFKVRSGGGEGKKAKGRGAPVVRLVGQRR
jgi:hypothetical protein